jgi:hypothetical protein
VCDEDGPTITGPTMSRREITGQEYRSLAPPSGASAAAYGDPLLRPAGTPSSRIR